MTAMYDTAKQFNRILYGMTTIDLKNSGYHSRASVSTQYHYDAKGMRIVGEIVWKEHLHRYRYVESGAPQTAPIVSNHIL